MDFALLLNGVLLGVGLSMDAFSISLVNGLSDPFMDRRRMRLHAGVFAAFQGLMPMAGWVCVHAAAQRFHAFKALIPWIALLLLSSIGGEMLVSGLRGGKKVQGHSPLGASLLAQGVAGSIDAFSAGFAIADHGFFRAMVSSVIIAFVTFVVCMAGLAIGKKFGTRLANGADILGGVILILIGLDIFVGGVLF